MPVELADIKAMVARCPEAVSKSNALFNQLVSKVQQDMFEQGIDLATAGLPSTSCTGKLLVAKVDIEQAMLTAQG